VPGDFLDLILLALSAAFAVAGYRQGFIIGVLSLAGFLGGVAGGAVIAPTISRALAHSPSWRAIVAIMVVFAAAVLGMLLASGLGVAVRARLTGRPATFLDSVGGAVVNVLSVLLLAWLIGSLVTNAASFPSVSRQVNGSLVLRAVDKVMPHGVLYLPLFPPLRGLLTGNGLYTPIFSAIGAEGRLDLPTPSRAVLNSPAAAEIRRSVVKIEGVAPSCSLKIEGSGFVISSQHVLTNAHVVAGVTDGPEVFATNGATYSSQVVFYDPQRDVAVLYVPGLTAPVMHFAGPAAYAAQAIVAGYPFNEPLKMTPATISTSIDAYGPNIYQTAVVHRQIYPISADVQPGNSGGPLVAPDGRVYGMVFAASTSEADTGYALTSAEIAGDVQAGEWRTAPVSTEGCQS
jgi:S1-C subfamily serine protease